MRENKKSRLKTWRERYKQSKWKKTKHEGAVRDKDTDTNKIKSNLNISLITSFLKAIGDKPWYESLRDISSSLPTTNSSTKVDNDNLLTIGTELLRSFGKTYSTSMSQIDADERWLHKYASGGEGVTKGDRLNSLALLLEQNAILNFICIKKLLEIAQSNVNRDRISALNVLHTLFVEKLLPSRKLLFLSQYSHLISCINANSLETIINEEITQVDTQLLLLITFEHHLKLAFTAFVEILGLGIKDHLFVVQKTCIDIATDLLIKQPEQEYALLQMLTKHVSNSDMKISSKISWNLRQVTNVHKGFKKFIIELIGNTLTHILLEMNTNFKTSTRWKRKIGENKRPVKKNKGLSKKVQENLISITKMLNFLSEIQNRNDPGTLQPLIKVYISFISTFFSEKIRKIYQSEDASRVIRAMTIGLDKCLDYSSDDLAETDVEKQIDINTLYRITHTCKSKATVITLLGLMYRCTIVFNLSKNRLFRLIYDKMRYFDIYDTSNERRLYNIVYQMLSQDDNIPRISAFIKRIFQSSMHNSNSSTTLAYSIIAHNVIYNNKKLKCLFKTHTDESYDSGKRDPEFSNAEKSYFWERHLLNLSYDPAISANLQKISAKVNKSKIINVQDLIKKVEPHDTFKKLELLVNCNRNAQYNQEHLQVYRKFFELEPKKDSAKGMADDADDEIISSSESGSDYEDAVDAVNFDQFKDDLAEHSIPKELEKILRNKSFINADELEKYI